MEVAGCTLLGKAMARVEHERSLMMNAMSKAIPAEGSGIDNAHVGWSITHRFCFASTRTPFQLAQADSDTGLSFIRTIKRHPQVRSTTRHINFVSTLEAGISMTCKSKKKEDWTEMLFAEFETSSKAAAFH